MNITPHQPAKYNPVQVRYTCTQDMGSNEVHTTLQLANLYVPMVTLKVNK